MTGRNRFNVHIIGVCRREGTNMNDALVLSSRNLCPIVRIGRVGKIFLFLEFFACCLEKIVFF